MADSLNRDLQGTLRGHEQQQVDIFSAQHPMLGHRLQKASPGGIHIAEQNPDSDMEVVCRQLAPCMQRNTEFLRPAVSSEDIAQDASPYSQHSPSVLHTARQGFFEEAKHVDVAAHKPSRTEDLGSPVRHLKSEQHRCEESGLEGGGMAAHCHKKQQLLTEASRLHHEQMNTPQVPSPQQQPQKGGLNISLIVEAVIAAVQSVPRPNSSLLIQLLELLVAVVAQQPQGQGLSPSDLSALETVIETVAKQEVLQQQEKIQQQMQQEKLKQMAQDSCLGPTDLAALETAIEAMNELQQQQPPAQHKQIQHHRGKHADLGISSEIFPGDASAVDLSSVNSAGQVAPGSNFSGGNTAGAPSTSTVCSREHFKRVPISVFLQEMYQGPPLPILSSSALAFGSSSESDSEERRLRKRKKERRVNAAAPDALWHPHFHPHNQEFRVRYRYKGSMRLKTLSCSRYGREGARRLTTAFVSRWEATGRRIADRTLRSKLALMDLPEDAEQLPFYGRKRAHAACTAAAQGGRRIASKIGKSGSGCQSEFGGEAAGTASNVSDAPLLQPRLRNLPGPADRASPVQGAQGDMYSLAARANDCLSSAPAGVVGTPGSVSLTLSSNSPVPSSRGSMEFAYLGASGDAATNVTGGNRGWTPSFQRKNAVDVLQESAGLRTPAAAPCEELRVAKRKALLNLAVNSGAANGSGETPGGALWSCKGEGENTTEVSTGPKGGDQQVTTRVPGAFAVLPTSTPPTVTPTSSGVFRNGGQPQTKAMNADSPLDEKLQRRSPEHQRQQQALDLLQLLGAGLDSSVDSESRGSQTLPPDDGLLRLLRDAAAADGNEDRVGSGGEKRQPVEARVGPSEVQRNQSGGPVEHKDEVARLQCEGGAPDLLAQYLFSSPSCETRDSHSNPEQYVTFGVR